MVTAVTTAPPPPTTTIYRRQMRFRITFLSGRCGGSDIWSLLLLGYASRCEDNGWMMSWELWTRRAERIYTPQCACSSIFAAMTYPRQGNAAAKRRVVPMLQWHHDACFERSATRAALWAAAMATTTQSSTQRRRDGGRAQSGGIHNETIYMAGSENGDGDAERAAWLHASRWVSFEWW
jgi:hypothetical protein